MTHTQYVFISKLKDDLLLLNVVLLWKSLTHILYRLTCLSSSCNSVTFVFKVITDSDCISFVSALNTPDDHEEVLSQIKAPVGL